MLTYLRLGYFWSTVTLFATNAPMCGFNSPNERCWRGDDGRMSYFYKRVINSRVVCIGTCCGIPKSGQRGGKLKAPSQVAVFSKYHNFWSIGRCPKKNYIVDNPQILIPGFLLINMTHIRRTKFLETRKFDLFFVFKNTHVCGQSYWFQSEKNQSTGYFSATNAPILGLKFPNKTSRGVDFLEHKNDIDTPAVLELWVLEIGPGLGRRGKEPATFPNFKNIYL